MVKVQVMVIIITVVMVIRVKVVIMVVVRTTVGPLEKLQNFQHQILFKNQPK